VLGLRGLPGVVSVSPDRAVKPMSVVPALGYDPADTGSLSSISQIVAAQAGWARGYTGQGVDVAVIDTGVARVSGLSATGKVIDGPDLSFDSPATATQGVDAFGHGTHMASIIAGRDTDAVASATGCSTCLNTSGYSDTTKFVGIAPNARIVNVKVGAADGAADVSQVIAAIDWVTQHAHDPGMNIRVLNLSFGTESTQAYTIDPLAQAAEQAWKHGIVVVAAAGNDGKLTETLANPAYDPYVLAVGADDPVSTLTSTDDKVAKFAQHGTAARPADVVAPGISVLGLRVPGSYVDTLAENTGKVGTRFQRGSGTSEATAVVSGVAALLAQKFPNANPDAIKALIKATATPLPKGSDPVKTELYSGKGIPNADKALAVTSVAASQAYTNSSGTGTLDAARGGVYVASNGVALTGQRDIFGNAFSSASMAALQTSASSWSGGNWNGSRWSGDGWSGSRWSGTTWAGTDWAGSRWSGSRWSGMTWDGSRWSGTGWSGSRWTSTGWTGSRWSSAGWT
jgi:serine protease AprX